MHSRKFNRHNKMHGHQRQRHQNNNNAINPAMADVLTTIAKDLLGFILFGKFSEAQVTTAKQTASVNTYQRTEKKNCKTCTNRDCANCNKL